MKAHAGVCEGASTPGRGFGKVGFKMTIGAVGSNTTVCKASLMTSHWLTPREETVVEDHVASPWSIMWGSLNNAAAIASPSMVGKLQLLIGSTLCSRALRTQSA